MPPSWLASYSTSWNLLSRVAARRPPAPGRRVVGRFRVHPGRATGLVDLLPERRAGLEEVHEELGRRESRLPMRGGGDHQHDVLARGNAAMPMDDGDAHQRPAFAGLGDVPFDLRFRHARIMLEREGGDRLAMLSSAADAGEGDDRADIG